MYSAQWPDLLTAIAKRIEQSASATRRLLYFALWPLVPLAAHDDIPVQSAQEAEVLWAASQRFHTERTIQGSLAQASVFALWLYFPVCLPATLVHIYDRDLGRFFQQRAQLAPPVELIAAQRQEKQRQFRVAVSCRAVAAVAPLSGLLDQACATLDEQWRAFRNDEDSFARLTERSAVPQLDVGVSDRSVAANLHLLCQLSSAKLRVAAVRDETQCTLQFVFNTLVVSGVCVRNNKVALTRRPAGLVCRVWRSRTNPRRLRAPTGGRKRLDFDRPLCAAGRRVPNSAAQLSRQADVRIEKTRANLLTRATQHYSAAGAHRSVLERVAQRAAPAVWRKRGRAPVHRALDQLPLGHCRPAQWARASRWRNLTGTLRIRVPYFCVRVGPTAVEARQ